MIKILIITDYVIPIRPTKHDLIRALAVHILLVEWAIEYFDISTPAVDVLFVFNSELDNKGLVFIAEGSELFAYRVKPCILRCLDTWEKFRKTGLLDKQALHFIFTLLVIIMHASYTFIIFWIVPEFAVA